MLWQYNWWTALYHLDGNANDSSGAWTNWTATNVTWVWGKIWTWAASWNWTDSSIWTSSQLVLSSWRIRCKVTTSWAGSSYRLIGWRAWRIAIYTVDSVLWIYDNTNFKFRSTWINIADWITKQIEVNFSYWTDLCDIYIDWRLVLTTTITDWDITTSYWSILSALDWTSTYQFFNWIVDEFIIETFKGTASDARKYYTLTKWRFWIL